MSPKFCYAEVRIKNPVLFEIFKRYKDQRAFEESYHNKVFASDEEHAIYLEEQRVLKFSVSPGNLVEVLDYIINMLAGDWLDSTPPNNDLVDSLKTELVDKNEEIYKAYESVRWMTYFYDEDDEYRRYRYRFDQNPWFEKFSVTTQSNDDGVLEYEPWNTGYDDREGW
ncbi:MAG: DUF1439 domain-containing protein [Fastidiosipila sp.]|nr:DUF1439 domain-containing protein [Fastidiosipila sp.]